MLRERQSYKSSGPDLYGLDCLGEEREGGRKVEGQEGIFPGGGIQLSDLGQVHEAEVQVVILIY